MSPVRSTLNSCYLAHLGTPKPTHRLSAAKRQSFTHSFYRILLLCPNEQAVLTTTHIYYYSFLMRQHMTGQSEERKVFFFFFKLQFPS